MASVLGTENLVFDSPHPDQACQSADHNTLGLSTSPELCNSLTGKILQRSNMIRFITISEEELSDGYSKSFAFFNTISDRFDMWSAENIWPSWRRFEEAVAGDEECQEISIEQLKETLERRRSLCPEWVFKNE